MYKILKYSSAFPANHKNQNILQDFYIYKSNIFRHSHAYLAMPLFMQPLHPDSEPDIPFSFPSSRRRFFLMKAFLVTVHTGLCRVCPRGIHCKVRKKVIQE